MAALSPRAPQGVSNQCPLCRSTIAADTPLPDGELRCPQCGGRLWLLHCTAGLRYHEADAVPPVRERVRDIVARKFTVPPEQLTGSVTFEDLGLDSLDVAELIMELEQEFDLTIDDEEVSHLRGINDLLDYLLWRKKSGGAFPR